MNKRYEIGGFNNQLKNPFYAICSKLKIIFGIDVLVRGHSNHECVDWPCSLPQVLGFVDRGTGSADKFFTPFHNTNTLIKITNFKSWIKQWWKDVRRFYARMASLLSVSSVREDLELFTWFRGVPTSINYIRSSALIRNNLPKSQCSGGISSRRSTSWAVSIILGLLNSIVRLKVCW